MFVDRSVPRISREYERFAFAREMKEALSVARAGGRARRRASRRPIPPDVMFRMLSSAVIGVAVLRLSDRLAPGEDADALARDVLDVTLAGLQAAPPASILVRVLRARRTDPHVHDAQVS